VVAVIAGLALLAAGQDDRAGIDFFEKRIRPVLVEHCYDCHSSKAARVKGGLLLDTRDGLRKGGESGPALAPGDAEASLLVKALRHDGLEMPPEGKLPAEVIAAFEKWIELGAPDPRVEAAARSAVPPSLEEARSFWSFQPPRAQELPAVRRSDWPRERIDWFVLEGLERAGLSPSPPAGARTFIRRLSFDLTGLPPAPEEVERFARDPSPRAREELVDRLLQSPRFGERWARLWLDVARYAEDQAHIVGSDKSLFYPNAGLYRDWVIAALNADMPYPRFIELQLAADLLGEEGEPHLAALGFLGLGPKYYGRGSAAVMADEWEDRVDVVGRGLLGLTIACARCHDHKYDPIPAADYYSLAGVFASTRMFNRPLDDGREKKEDGEAKSPADALHIVREGNPRDLNVFIRGSPENLGPLAPRRFLQVLSSGEPIAFTQGSGRLELARAIASRGNPLTARVIVNRIWTQCFGRPLVATASNFGALGEAPSHPELLDDLAARFMEAGWSLKWLLREIVLSAAYGQASEAGAELLAADPENRLLGRMSRRRLSVESWRDALVSAAGLLDESIGGPSIDPLSPEERRRTLYSSVSRLQLNRLLALFDFPDPNVHAERRAETTTPLQKLFLLNSRFSAELARGLAARLEAESGGGGDGAVQDLRRIGRAYALLFGREATPKEAELGLAFLRDEEGGDPQARLRAYAQALLASNEMLFID
jgi:hypothetical protein